MSFSTGNPNVFPKNLPQQKAQRKRSPNQGAAPASWRPAPASPKSPRKGSGPAAKASPRLRRGPVFGGEKKSRWFLFA